MKDKVKLRDELEAGNQRSYEELQNLHGGRFQMDTSDLRREMFFDKMVEWGLVTEEQMLDFDIEFHRKVEDALNNAHESYREKNQKRNLQVVKKGDKLVDKHGRPLK